MSEVSICSGLAATLNATLLYAAVTYVHQITALYPSVYYRIRYSSVTIACMRLQSLCEVAFFPRPEVGRCMAFGYRWYS